MSSPDQTSPYRLSMEAVPAGRAVPDWLFEALLSGRRLLIIHPSEESRRQTIEKLHVSGSGLVDTTHHLTLKRLIGLLHLDLKLPALFEDDGVLFEICHSALSEHASNFGFPIIHPDPKRAWSRARSKRLLQLHKELCRLVKPFEWQDDPGARECDVVIRRIETEHSATHPSRARHRILLELQNEDATVFTLNGVDGIVMLDHEPTLDEIDLEILKLVSARCPIHQLVNPGSHRLGFHGEYIADIEPVRKADELPNWVPNHTIEQSLGSDMITQIAMDKGISIHQLLLESPSHSSNAIADLIMRSEKEMTIVSGDPNSLRQRLKPYLDSMSIRTKESAKSLDRCASVARILTILKLPMGQTAWSLESLRDFHNQSSLQMNWAILDTTHPKEQEWKPTLHLDLLSEIARGFHINGGKGALKRWLSILRTATPRSGVNPEKRRQELEETQWWIAIMANWMYPLIGDHDLQALEGPVIGSSTGIELPLPSRFSDTLSWFNSLLEQVDWGALISDGMESNHSVAGIQYLSDSLTRLIPIIGIPETGRELYEMLESVARATNIPGRRGNDSKLTILSPKQSLGVECELLILEGIDANTWSMRPPQIPWLSTDARMKIGIHRPDENLRKGRHQLRHLMNCASTIIVLDATMQEGVEFSGPLDEWYSNLNIKQKNALRNPPEIITPESWNVNTANRPWRLGSKDSDDPAQDWLIHNVILMESTSGEIRNHRSGMLDRDIVQRAGLAALEDRRPSKAPLDKASLAIASENIVLDDQYSRRTTGVSMEQGDIFNFENAPELVRTSGLKLTPHSRLKPDARHAEVWPHLGVKAKSKFSLGIDPRPILPPSTNIEELDARTGRTSVKFKVPKVWSQGRLQSWLNCPRKAWYNDQHGLGRDEKMSEDIAPVTRGNIIHLIEERILQSHGLVEGKIPELPLPLASGPLANPDFAQTTVLQGLEELAPWLSRKDGVSFFRSQTLIGASPTAWNDWVEDRLPFELGGKIGGLLDADLQTNGVAPIASEWNLGGSNHSYVSLSLPENPSTLLKLRGRIDRVDSVLASSDLVDVQASEVIPLDLSMGERPPASRLVIIRDLKSVDGGEKEGMNKHKNSLFEQLQLALYARSWEIEHPGDRVIGVGVTSVGSSTTHWVEIDPEYSEELAKLNLGELTFLTHEHYRLPGSGIDCDSNPFRAWIRERITTALRVIKSVENGNIHPEPSGLCNYCPIIDACPSGLKEVSDG